MVFTSLLAPEYEKATLGLEVSSCFSQVRIFFYILLRGVKYPLTESSSEILGKLYITPGDLLKTAQKLPKPWIWVII